MNCPYKFLLIIKRNYRSIRSCFYMYSHVCSIFVLQVIVFFQIPAYLFVFSLFHIQKHKKNTNYKFIYNNIHSKIPKGTIKYKHIIYFQFHMVQLILHNYINTIEHKLLHRSLLIMQIYLKKRIPPNKTYSIYYVIYK